MTYKLVEQHDYKETLMEVMKYQNEHYNLIVKTDKSNEDYFDIVGIATPLRAVLPSIFITHTDSGEMEMKIQLTSKGTVTDEIKDMLVEGYQIALSNLDEIKELIETIETTLEETHEIAH